jgi:hypothetical protein
LTVAEVPHQSGVPGDDSGRQRKQGRKPASSAAAAVTKKRTFSVLGRGAGADGPTVDASGENAGEETAVVPFIPTFYNRVTMFMIKFHDPIITDSTRQCWPFSDITLGD